MIFAVAAVASLISHLVIRVLHIEISPKWVDRTGVESGAKPISAAGSSLLGYGLDWEQISQETGKPIDRYGLPAASPSELEYIIRAHAGTGDVTVVGISVFDLNENQVSDFRSEVVSIRASVRDLWASNADWSRTKRVLGQYPLTWTRVLYPTAGRSLGVMVGVRRLFRTWVGRLGPDVDVGPKFDARTHVNEKIEDWDKGRVLRNLSQIRADCQGRWDFHGPKHLALRRLLSRTVEREKVMMVVFPVSPPVEQEFITPAVKADFERMLSDIEAAFPNAKWVRIDKIPTLQSPRYYWDLIHLNQAGQQVATSAFLPAFKALLEAK